MFISIIINFVTIMALIDYYRGKGANEVAFVDPVANSSVLVVTVDTDSENDV